MDTELILKYNLELRKSLPIECHGVLLYPVLYKDKEAYDMFIHVLTYNPIYFQDVELSTLPRLYFITSVLKEPQETAHPLRRAFISELCGLLSFVLREQEFDFRIQPSGQIGLVIFKDKEHTSEVEINANKFEDIRKIILLQNDTFCEDRYIHPDILRWIEEQKEHERKHSAKKYIDTTEDQVEAMMITFGNPDEKFLDDMTIRRVNRLYEKAMDKPIFEAQMNGAMSGMVKFKESPTSWAVTKPKQTDFDKYLRELHPDGAPAI